MLFISIEATGKVILTAFLSNDQIGSWQCVVQKLVVALMWPVLTYRCSHCQGAIIYLDAHLGVKDCVADINNKKHSGGIDRIEERETVAADTDG